MSLESLIERLMYLSGSTAFYLFIFFLVYTIQFIRALFLTELRLWPNKLACYIILERPSIKYFETKQVRWPNWTQFTKYRQCVADQETISCRKRSQLHLRIFLWKIAIFC